MSEFSAVDNYFAGHGHAISRLAKTHRALGEIRRAWLRRSQLKIEIFGTMPHNRNDEDVPIFAAVRLYPRFIAWEAS